MMAALATVETEHRAGVKYGIDGVDIPMCCGMVYWFPIGASSLTRWCEHCDRCWSADVYYGGLGQIDASIMVKNA